MQAFIHVAEDVENHLVENYEVIKQMTCYNYLFQLFWCAFLAQNFKNKSLYNYGR